MALDRLTRPFHTVWNWMSQFSAFRLLKETSRQWYGDNTFQLGAALAYYTIFSLAPVVVIAIAVAGLIFGEEAARGQISREIGHLAGPAVADAVEQTVRNAADTGMGGVAAIISVGVLIVGATTVFAQLQQALNTIWGVRPKEGRGLLGILKDRFWTFTIVLAIGFLLLVSLIVSAALSAAAAWLPGGAHLAGIDWWRVLNVIVSFTLVTLLFALIYKLLPDAEIAWRDVWVGAAVTSAMFAVGKYLIGLYLGQSGTVSAFGAAGSLVLILLWVYYSSQILLFGAEFTQVYANRKGKPIVATANAEPIPDEEGAPQRAPGKAKAVASPAMR
jgi:membrane protein